MRSSIYFLRPIGGRSLFHFIPSKSHQSPILDSSLANGIPPDPRNGKYIYTAAGCANCHIEKGSENKFILAGGQAFKSQFRTLYVPNVSMSKTMVLAIGSSRNL